jgi:hypothetical protein
MLALLSLLLVAPPAHDTLSPSLRAEVEVLRLLARVSEGEPTIEEVQREAAERTRVDREQLDAWGRRARAAAWLPRLSVEYRHELRSTRVVGLTGTLETDYLRLSPGDVLGVRASWDLDALIFTPDELKAAGAAAGMLRRREEAVQRATRLYFERRRLRLLLLLAPPSTAAERAERELELEAATAELDAVTGGLLSRPRAR